MSEQFQVSQATLTRLSIFKLQNSFCLKTNLIQAQSLLNNATRRFVNEAKHVTIILRNQRQIALLVISLFRLSGN